MGCNMNTAPETYNGKPLAHSWPYTVGGDAVGLVARYEDASGKEVIPFKPNGKPGALDEPRPLFGLDHIQSGKPVFVVEGEKCAAALQSLGLAAVTSQGGSKAADKTDWQPIQAANVVYLLPDNDEPGTLYMEAVASLVGGDNLQLVALPSLPNKGDAVDFLQGVVSGWNGLEPIPGQQREKALDALREAVKSFSEPYKVEPEQWPEIVPLPEQGDIGEPESYPLQLLPDSTREAVGEVARFSMVPKASPAVVGLAVIATAIGKRAIIVERPGHTHYPALFFALVAGSGERKSPAFKAMSFSLGQWADDQMQDYEALKIEAISNNTIVDAQISGLKGLAKKPDADLDQLAIQMQEQEARRIPMPPYPSLFTTDTTEQRLFQKIHERNGAYAVMSGEGRPVIDAIMGKYSGDGRTGDAVYLAGISGDTITRDRVGGDSGPEERVIRNPCLNVCIMAQPDKYLEAASCPALRASGALARIWPVWLPVKAGTRFESKDDRGLDDTKLAAFNNLVKTVLNHERPVDEKGFEIPHRAVLSPEAANARREFHNAIETLLAEGGELEDMRDIASKAVSQTCKLALVLHIANNPAVLDSEQSVINNEIWAVAQALGTFHLTEATRVQRVADENPLFEQARKVVAWIKRERVEVISSTVLMQQGPRPRPKAAQADSILELLAEHNFLAMKREPGKRKPVYTVNPELCSQSSQCSRGKP